MGGLYLQAESRTWNNKVRLVEKHNYSDSFHSPSRVHIYLKKNKKKTKHITIVNLCVTR